MSVYFVKGKGKGWRYDFTPDGDQVHRSLVQDKNRGQKGRIKKKGGVVKSTAGSADTNRHGLLGSGESQTRSCEGVQF